jgi:hypothetical protein
VTSLSAWKVSTDSGPIEFRLSTVPSELELEKWIHKQPAIVGHGIETVTRQLSLGGKKHNVSREALSQGIDYAARLAELPFEEFKKLVNRHRGQLTANAKDLIDKAIDRENSEGFRDIRILLAGVGTGDDLDRMVRYLGERSQLPISVVSLRCFAGEDGTDFVLIREDSDDDSLDVQPDSSTPASSYGERMAAVRAHANALGQQEPLDAMIEEFSKNNALYVRPYKRGVMIAPAGQKSRYLAYFAPRSTGVMGHFGVDELEEFFPGIDRGALEGLDHRSVFDSEEAARKWSSKINQAVADATTDGVGPERYDEWDGQSYYVSFGDEEARAWDDARRYGFISAGGGEWYAKTLRNLEPSSRIFVCIPSKGYVGVGRTTGPATKFEDSFLSEKRDLKGTYRHRNGEAEYIVPVEWEMTVDVKNALWQLGWFANENSACKLRHRPTLDGLKSWLSDSTE